jgi:hypothetical protein
MSQHYEFQLSFDVRPDAPESFLTELQWHLGLGPRSAEESGLDRNQPVLAGDDEYLAGGGYAFVGRRVIYEIDGREIYRDTVFVRRYLLDDDLYDLMTPLLTWVAQYCDTQGWIGFAREEFDLQPWLFFYVQDGQPYTGDLAEAPTPLLPEAAPWRLEQTGQVETLGERSA